AEDGIRDRNVTGVQTCALPISKSGKSKEDADVPRPRGMTVFGFPLEHPRDGQWPKLSGIERRAFVCGYCGTKTGSKEGWQNIGEIGRASCRERGYISSVVEVRM